MVCTGLLVPFCRRCAPGLNWPGRASGAVTLKKLECSKQAYALYTLAWDNIIGFRSYYVAFGIGVMINRDSRGHSYFIIIAIVGLQRGIPSKRESSARVDYVPALCTHRPSLLPIEWSGEVLGSRRRGRFAAGDVARNSTEPYHLEEGEVVTSCAQSHPAEGTPAWASRIASPPTMHPLSGHMASGRSWEALDEDPQCVVLRRCFDRDPRSGGDYPLSLSISISGGKETYKDSLSNGERTGISPA
ncbi:hypothetical protein L1887_63576 [Cichorium endivia]|nr:hypothetical protein L1887_63576 [Cichorium endivia]